MTTKAGYPEPDEMFGPYRIVRRLGVGGMGIVFEAVDTTLGRSVALKVISPNVDDDETFRARFRDEAQGQASLDSPHVVSVFAHGDVGGRLYIATQLVPGGDLGALITANGPPPLGTGCDIIAQVAVGLGDAHDAGVIHRDLKPPNVLLRRRGNEMHAYLADFGIARQVGRDQPLTMAGGTIGTPSFMAPELHTGGSAGPASDIYSLGCLLWATLTGKSPYAGTSDYELIRAHIEAPIPQLAADGPAVEQVNRILLMSMAKRPDQRYPSAAAMRADLQSASRLPGPAGPLTPVTQPAGPPLPSASAGATAPTQSPGTALPTGPPKSGASRAPRYAVIALVAVVVLAFLGYVAVDWFIAGDAPSSATEQRADDPGAAPTDAPTSEPEPSQDPTGPSVSSELTDADRELARDNMADVIAEVLPGDLIDADCVAEEWIAEAGLETLIDEGFFDEDLTFIDLEEDEMSDSTRRAALDAVASCTFE